MDGTWLERARRPRFAAGTLRYGAVGLGLVIAWLLTGELGMAMRDRAIVPASLEMLRRYGASDNTVSVLLSGVPAVLSLFMVPLIGPVSDRLRGRWGRRRPFLFLLAPSGALTLAGMAASQRIGAAAALGGAAAPDYALTVFALCWSVFCAVVLCAKSLYFALVNDVLPSAWLGRFFGLYRIVSLSIGIAFYCRVFPALDHALYAITALAGLVFGASIILMCVMVREGEYPPAAPAPDDAPGRGRPALAVAFALPRAGWIYAALALGGMVFGPFNTFSQYYAASLGMSKAALGELSALAYGVSIVLALPIGILADRIGALRVSLWVMALYGAAIGAGYAVLRDGAAFGPVYLVHVVLSGAYFTAAASLPMALFPRLDFLRYCAFSDVLGSLAGIALSAVQGALLDRTGHDYRVTLLYAACAAAACTLCLARLAWAQGAAARA